ncbi:MAG: TolC family protein [Verrucomicrobiota bacterium]
MKPSKKKKNRQLSVFIGLCLLSLSLLQAEETTLTLSECIRMAMQKNLNLSFQRLNPEISKAQLLSAKGDFDLVFSINNSYSETDTPVSSSTFTTVHEEDHTFGLSQKTPFGTVLGLSNTLDNSSSNLGNYHDSYSSFWGASFTQPLLKNFGTDNNLFNIRSAQLDVNISDASFQNTIDQTVTDVANAFFELRFAREDLQSKRLFLQYAEQLLIENKTRLEIGTMTKLDVSQANFEVATRTEEIIQAEREIKTRENDLKLLITDQFQDWLNKTIIPNPDPVFETTPPTISKAFNNALTNRPDLLQIKKSAEQKNLILQYQKNQEWPQLDLYGSYGFNGLDNTVSSSFRDVSEFNKDEWTIGLSLKIPFQNRLARGVRQQAQLQQQQTLIQVKQKEQTIMSEVDNALGQVLTNQKRVESTESGRAYAEETLEAEREKYSAGASTTFTVLRLQRDASDAQSKEIRAKIDLEKSLAELHRVQGLSLVYVQEAKNTPPLSNP